MDLNGFNLVEAACRRNKLVIWLLMLKLVSGFMKMPPSLVLFVMIVTLYRQTTTNLTKPTENA